MTAPIRPPDVGAARLAAATAARLTAVALGATRNDADVAASDAPDAGVIVSLSDAAQASLTGAGPLPADPHALLARAAMAQAMLPAASADTRGASALGIHHATDGVSAIRPAPPRPDRQTPSGLSGAHIRWFVLAVIAGLALLLLLRWG